MTTRKLCLLAERAYLGATWSDAGTDSQALAVVDGSDLVLAFRGTSSRQDLWTDLRAVRRLWRWGGHVHAGFAGAYESLRAHVLPAVAQHPGPVWLTGHSLGGALATLAADDLRHLGHAPRLATYGAPPVGLPGWHHGSALDPRDVRYVYRGDAVAWGVGLRVLGYRHHCRGTLLGGRWWPSACRSLCPGLRWRDHALANYLAALL